MLTKERAPLLLAAILMLGGFVAMVTKRDQAAPAVATTIASVEPPPPAPAVDHLEPGELLEGNKSAFGLPLPSGTNVRGAFVGVVYAQHPASVKDLQKYFAARVREVRSKWREDGVSMDKVKLPSNPSITLSIAIDANHNSQGSRITIYDATEQPPADLPSDEARWNAVGLTKDGHLRDPDHYH